MSPVPSPTPRRPAALALALALTIIGPAVAQTRTPASAMGEYGPFINTYAGPERIMRGDLGGAAKQTLTRARQLGAAAAIPEHGDPTRGVFSPAVDWPLVPIHAVLTLDGRVLTYGTDENGAQGASLVYDVWDPLLGLSEESHRLLPNRTAVDIFCGAQLTLPDGNIGLFGGDNFVDGRTTNTPNQDVTQFNLGSNELTRTGAMWRARWYASAITLPNNAILIQGGLGGEDYPEVRDRDGAFRLMTGADTKGLDWFYPRIFVDPRGKVFGLAHDRMYRIDPEGDGAIRSLGRFPGDNIGTTSTAVMFQPGRILQLGGGPAQEASAAASIIDLGADQPQVSATAPMRWPRHWANATVLADGKVLVSGGSRVANSDTDVAYTAELYDPAEGRWTEAASASRMRLYHSVSLLLPDATVLTAGGGVPGPQRNLNAEIYYPPYLFNPDGTRASRPRIESAPMTAAPNQSIRFTSPDAERLARVTLVKTGSVTHSFDSDQRFIELPWSRTGDQVTARLDDERHQFPPGTYMLFALDQQGTPSEASMLRIGSTPDRDDDDDDDDDDGDD